MYIPLLNIPATDLHLRPEFTALFRHADVDASQIITLDDIPLAERIEEILKPANTRWILVDHNKLQGRLGSIYSTRVRGVIDHHEDESSVPQDTDPEPRTIEICGSCTSLVVRTLKSTWDTLSSSRPRSEAAESNDKTLHEDNTTCCTWDAQIAKMALASILEDTANLTAEGKVEPSDQEAVAYLEAKIRQSPQDANSWSREHFYQEIHAAKINLEGLPLKDVLRKDYKQWTENSLHLGISSVFQPLDSLINPVQNLNHAIHTFMTSRSLSLFALMTAFTTPDGTFHRELLLQHTSSPGSIAAASHFSRHAAAELGLEPWRCADREANVEAEGRQTWVQREVAKSRKQVAPLLRDAMRCDAIR